jgi:hypothetical protein
MSGIFISSSGENTSLARRLARDLKEEGFEPYVPGRDMRPGAVQQLVEQMSQSDAFLVLVEPNPKRTPAREREWFEVLNEASDMKKGKKLIPLVVGSGETPNFLKNWEALHVPDPDDSKRWNKMISTISLALRSKAKPKFRPLPKADLVERKRRMADIVAAANHFKSLGM